MDAIECRNCKGSGTTSDVRHVSITHRRTEVARTCRYCKGTGTIVPIVPKVQVESDPDGDIPEWMLG